MQPSSLKDETETTMAACGSLQHIFDKPLKTPKSLFDSLPTWNHINPIDDSSQMHFKHKSDSATRASSELDLSPPSVTYDGIDKTPKNYYFSTKDHQHNISFSSMSSESLSMCTEGLGFESFDDVEELRNEEDVSDKWKLRRGFDTRTKHGGPEMLSGGPKRSRMTRAQLPPPISSIGSSGKPWVYLKSYRDNGRFILKEVRIPTQEFLYTSREHGRLKLWLFQSDDDTINEDEDEEQTKRSRIKERFEVDQDRDDDDDDDTMEK